LPVLMGLKPSLFRAMMHAQRTMRRRSRQQKWLSAVVVVASLAVVSAFSSGFVLPPRALRSSPENLMGPAIGSALFGALPAEAADSVSSQTDLLPIVGVVAVGALVAVLGSGGSDEKVDDKKVVKEYFNNEGFERWQKIYGDKDDVNAVQKDIRVGHAETVDKILKWLDPATISGKTVCDAGCGTGYLSIPLAERGADVSASDISAAMVGEATERAKAILPAEQQPKFFTSDLEAVDGKFDTVCCVDVLIHYPPENMAGMVKHLAGLSKERVVLSFAPKTWYYVALKRIGELFPGKSKTTRAYLHEEELVEAAFEQAGFQVTRKEMTATNFYFSRLFEAKPKVA